MSFKVKLFDQAPDFDSLHVAKLTDYPLEPRDYKPYAQAQFCFSPAGMHVRLSAFEAISLPDSALHAVIAHGADGLHLTIFADGRYQAFLHAGETISVLEVKLHPFTGEDLQGVFWGAVFTVSTDFWPQFKAVPGAILKGNFYKTCEAAERPHYGSFYPASFSLPLTSPENLGPMELIDY